MNQKRLLPWYGANTANAKRVAELLRGAGWVGIPFCGGMADALYIRARSLVVNDIHSHVINLCHVLRDDAKKEALIEVLDATAFHPQELIEAQAAAPSYSPERHGLGNVLFARAYFVSQWLGRSGQAGTDKEFEGKISTRTNANGGDSCKRFRSAIESLSGWATLMRRCNFSNVDFREWFDQYNGDTDGHAYYVDAPWVKGGERYRHKFSPACHADLADRLRAFGGARVVVRYDDDPLIRKLYDGWHFESAPSRNQGNALVDEVLITNQHE